MLPTRALFGIRVLLFLRGLGGFLSFLFGKILLIIGFVMQNTEGVLIIGQSVAVSVNAVYF